jgi:hypothetical protein
MLRPSFIHLLSLSAFAITVGCGASDDAAGQGSIADAYSARERVVISQGDDEARAGGESTSLEAARAQQETAGAPDGKPVAHTELDSKPIYGSDGCLCVLSTQRCGFTGHWCFPSAHDSVLGCMATCVE